MALFGRQSLWLLLLHQPRSLRLEASKVGWEVPMVPLTLLLEATVAVAPGWEAWSPCWHFSNPPTFNV